MIFRQLFTKYPVGKNGEPWSEKLEWRYACFSKTLEISEDEKGMLISVPIPRKIIFGKNMLEENKTQIIDWIGARQYDIEIQQMI